MELTITSQAGWLLLGAAVLSAVYELWRAVARTGVMRYDSIAAWLQSLMVVAVEVVVALLLLAGWEWAPHAGLILAGGLFLVSVFYYGPKVLFERKPGLVDHFEDRVYTALVAIVAVLLGYQLLGATLTP
jgi:hypothetical protein